MAINSVEALGKFFKTMQGVVRVKPKVDTFFKSFFPDKIGTTLGTNFEIVRSGRKVLNDIGLNDEPIITQIKKSTEKLFIPPSFDVAAQIDALSAYERVAGAGDYVTEAMMMSLIEESAEEVQKNLDSLERREELMCAQALEGGIISLNNGDDINYHRRAESLIAYALANDWSVSTVDPGVMLIQMAEVLVTYGMVSPGGAFNLILGDEALRAFQNNAIIKSRGDIKDNKYMSLTTGFQIGTGATPQGIASFGNYTFNLWGYSGRYENSAGTTINYMNTKKVILLPDSPDFQTWYGGVRQWSAPKGTPGRYPAIVSGKRTFWEAEDEMRVQKLYGFRSRPLPILREVDRVVTAQVVPT